MEDSILNSVKKVLGVDPEYKDFDIDIIMHINSVFMVLHQLGVGPEEGYAIKDTSDKWSDFIGDNKLLNAVQSLIFIRVRLLFDRPETSYGIQALERQAKEFEWRLNVQSEKG